MADTHNEKPQVVRSREPGAEAAREAKERRRVAEIARDIEQLGRLLEGRDRLARFGTAARTRSSPAQAGQFGRVGDHSTPGPESPSTSTAMCCASKEVSPEVVKFATTPDRPRQRKLVTKGGPPARRGMWGLSFASAIIVLFLVFGGALMLTGSPIEMAQDAYRSTDAEMQQLIAQGIETAQDAYRSADAEMQRLTAQGIKIAQDAH